MRPGEVNEPLAPPAPFRQTSPYTLELRERSGRFAVLLGVLFFLVGAFMALSLIRVLPYEATPKREWNFLVLPLMAVVFLGLGGVMLLGRRWLTLDLGSGSLIRQQGLLIPMRSEVRGLNDFTAVAISFDPGDSESPERYPVYLRAAKGKDFVITTPQQFGEARKQAEYLSRFLRLPLADATTDHQTVVSQENVSATLRDRLVCGEAENRPIQPPRMLSQVTESPGDTTVMIPGPRVPLSWVPGALFPFVILLIVIPAIVRLFSPDLSTWSAWLAFLILALILGLPSIALGARLMADGVRRKTTVKASPAGLLIEQRRAWRTRTKAVLASDILDLDQSTFEGVLASRRSSFTMTAPPGAFAEGLFAALRKRVPNKGIVVKSRQEVITLGEGLPAGELQYLRWVLRRALAGR